MSRQAEIDALRAKDEAGLAAAGFETYESYTGDTAPTEAAEEPAAAPPPGD